MTPDRQEDGKASKSVDVVNSLFIANLLFYSVLLTPPLRDWSLSVTLIVCDDYCFVRILKGVCEAISSLNKS
jgi:hypothetical protein